LKFEAPGEQLFGAKEKLGWSKFENLNKQRLETFQRLFLSLWISNYNKVPLQGIELLFWLALRKMLLCSNEPNFMSPFFISGKLTICFAPHMIPQLVILL